MKTYIKYLLENTKSKTFDKTVALVAGSYKPPTAGHLYMVECYAKQADSVLVLISNPKSVKSIRTTSLGTIITPEMSKQIWEIYIKAYHLKNVKVIISDEASPVRAMCKYVDSSLIDVNVIFGVSNKDNDAARYDFALKYYEDNPHINLLNPADTAVEPYSSPNGKPVSATDIRNNITNPDVIKSLLPEKLTDSQVKQVIKILSTGKKLTESDLGYSLEPTDETEAVHIFINDDVLQHAKIAAYNIGQVFSNYDGEEKDIPYNPKKFPDKAVDIIIPVQNTLVEIFLDTNTCAWDSNIIFNKQHVKLSPDQMEGFFTSQFYNRMLQILANKWPLSDEFFSALYRGLVSKTLSIGLDGTLHEDDDKSMSNKDIDGDDKRDFTASGRKITKFSDNNATMKNAAFYCWPNDKHPFKYTQWKDWKKIKPLCRIRFFHGGIPYGISLSTLGDEKDYKNRGFRGYSLDPSLPPVQWLTSEENQSIIKLSIVNKFIKQCVEKISKYVSMTAEEIYEKIGEPEKITLQEVEKTRSCIRKTLNEVIKPKQIDNFKWN